jgi:translation initiation factor 3 subunit D
MDCAKHHGQGRCHEAWVFLLFFVHKSLTNANRFVSRANPKTNDKHVILGVVGWKPRDFAQQMNLSLSNGWGIVRTIADMCLKREEGKYVLVKDPNKQILRLYEVPAGSFEEEEQGEVIEEVAEDEE